MGRAACTEPQCLYKGALLLYTFRATNQLTPWDRVLLEKLINPQRINKIPRILRNQNVYYRIQNSPPFVHILNRINPVHASHLIY